MGELMVGKCQCCGKDNVPLIRKYFHYKLPDGLKCECCGTADDTHFVIVDHCKECKPKEPREVKVVLSTKNLERLDQGE